MSNSEKRFTSTNFSLSKKLKEIGFTTPTDKCWAKVRNSKLDEFSLRALDFSIPATCDEYYLSYTLEALLEALPKRINNNQQLRMWFAEDTVFIGYQNWNDFDNEFTVKGERESLADMTARLLIKLFESGIITNQI